MPLPPRTTSKSRVRLCSRWRSVLGHSPERRVEERLGNALRRHVYVPLAVDEVEPRPTLVCEPRGIVPMDRKAAAHLWAIKREGGDHGNTAWRHGPLATSNVVGAVGRVGQEVEDRTVVPHV